MRRAGPFFAALLAATCLSAPALAAPDALFAEYFDHFFAAYPEAATGAGRHDHDTEITDVSLAGHEARQKMLHHYLDLFRAIDTSTLPVIERDDVELLIGNIKSVLLDEERIQGWRVNPDSYAGNATNAVFSLIRRNFAAPEIRLQATVAREKQLPGMLATAQSILINPAPIYVEIALLQIDDNIAFFRKDLPAAFEGVGDAALRADFAKSNAEVIAALEKYKAYVKKVQPKATGNFALGAENYRQKLLYDEMVDTPVDEILKVGMANLRKDQALLVATAKEIDPKHSVEQVLDAVSHDHVAANQLIPTAQAQLASLRQFIVDHKIITLAPGAEPKVAETPAFMRATTFASMDAPGPLERAAKEAYYFVTLPDPRWPAAKQESYLKGYNNPLLQNVSVHEVWPGHFVQYLFMTANPQWSLARKLVSATTTVEGWAHYTEQMMLDQGLGNGDPKLRLMQATDALLRDCRLVVGISLHTKGMSIAQARQFFVKEGHQQPVVGEVETYRGTEDPTYLYYTLGKLGILKLRADVQAKQGDKFDLQAFHDSFNNAGTIPLKLIRRELLGVDGPLL